MESWKHLVKGENEINKNSKKKERKKKVKRKNLSVRVTLEGPKYFQRRYFSPPAE